MHNVLIISYIAFPIGKLFILPESWDETRDYFYPIPTDDRSLTGGALTQNPGWNDGLNF